MNPANILALLSDLYQQIVQLTEENETLKARLAEPVKPDSE